MRRIGKNLVSLIIGTVIFGCGGEIARNDVDQTSEHSSVTDQYLLAQRSGRIERYSDNLTGCNGTITTYRDNLTGEECRYSQIEN